ncbi:MULTISPECIES: PhzF family phenazine biosynthesis protein [Bacillaceae]|uniref:Phenazine biosynthesis protein n=1 Tax=Peribacillus simplex TaxID=1478 RepID=A0AAN2PLE7_9BACI|nr:MULTISPECIES: PhzF family phenazine biosynthesis protein [Bacillaceae]MCP1096769.1 PhzF family phenazine biosynthesis protein [Bacillaceae bacterium OS4b]MCF7624687.1 PhzF family phenazine biosynthesis protein [Peribacillus frigoritolerans]MCP1155230.1 PhzF family phenazine biosynthesis protein [Peribacillus frigoritolerans]MCT1389984.1 PhzF family phenazine biosynthesis protein [Peribacillus frigoritolerans]MEA3574896.1 PhzF family phenazine biosynthesis protein [Peribacillus frigoritolera
MELTIINTFTDQPFKGNPAAVCLLTGESDSEWMQRIAKEINMPVTAFIQPHNGEWKLRWFTPSIEIPICGHGTLASSFFLWDKGYVPRDQPIAYQTKSGLLTAKFVDGMVQLEFPSLREKETTAPDLLIKALGVVPAYVGQNKWDLLVEVQSEEIVRNLKLDIDSIAQLPVRGVIVTSQSDSSEYDFVSRFFSPAQGLDEDQVTGSAHCCLGPYWKRKLDKSNFIAHQASERGGQLKVEVTEDTVKLSGHAVTIFEGNLTI